MKLRQILSTILIAVFISACGSPEPAHCATNAQSIEFLLSQVRASGTVLAGGRVYFYSAGTSTLKTVWLNRNKATEAANPYTLDANGTAQLYGDGLYRVVIKDSAGVTKYDRDNLSFKDVSGYAYDLADYASLSAAITSIGSTTATLQYGTDITLTANVTFPANIELLPLNGAIINLNGYTITGLKRATPDMFGKNTVPGTTDMSAAITRAAAALAENGTLTGGAYSVASAVTLSPRINVDLGLITYTGSANEAAVTYGSIATRTYGNKIKLGVSRSTISDWSSESSIGLKIINVQASDITVNDATNFTVGVRLMGDSGGCQYNNVKLFNVTDNKIGVDLYTQNTGSVGWVNSNSFFGGNIAATTSSPLNVSRYGVRITSTSTYYSNDNHFYNTVFQLSSTRAGTGEALPILIEYGQGNSFENVRMEGNSANKGMRVTNLSNSNAVIISYFSASGTTDIPRSLKDDQTTDTEDTSNYVAMSLRQSSGGAGHDNLKTVFQSVPFNIWANYYSAGVKDINIPGVILSTTAADGSHQTVTSLASNYVELGNTRQVGVMVDTSITKEFVVSRDVETSYPGRLSIRCYDANGVVLTSADANHPYVKFTGAVYGSTFGGAYAAGSDNGADLSVKFHADVKTALIGIKGGTATLRIRSFAIYAPAAYNGTSAVWVTYGEGIPGVNLSSIVPVKGVWTLGQRALMDPPTVGQAKGWFTTVGGGAYGATRANTTAYVANDWIKWDSGTTTWECTTAGTSAGSAPSIVGKVVGDTVTDGTAIWTMRSLTAATLTSEGNL